MLLIQFLNALQFSMTLFLLAVGLTIIFGLMKIVNLAHGSLYMVGAYLGLSITNYTDSFWLALVIAPILTALIGAILYSILFKHIQNADPMKQVLLTFGLIYIALDSVRLLWGTMSHSISAPNILSNSILLVNEPYPSYRLFVIAIGLIVLFILYIILEKTKIGAKVRASVDDPETAQLLKINTDKILFYTFALGCGLAGLAGITVAPILGVEPGMDMEVLVLTLIVVVVGGPGSLKGAIIGSLLIGFVDSFGKVYIPQLAQIIIYAVMALTILFKPDGLYKR
ncbi:branched-chain amino acid ABC transporter permease [Alphaproteobacteria bacterium]|jgi:branched-chain amino acid transport system permease protein|nr:branched-chain amino acid ABC transporter permease [Alphaproteobacteria bacterium]